MNDGSNDDQPRARPDGPTLTRQLETIHRYLEGAAAAVIMATLGVVSGVAMLALTGDLRLALLVAAVAFTLTGIVLTVRLWRMTRAPAPPAEPPA